MRSHNIQKCREREAAISTLNSVMFTLTRDPYSLCLLIRV